jgi:hypothetical protein
MKRHGAIEVDATCRVCGRYRFICIRCGVCEQCASRCVGRDREVLDRWLHGLGNVFS